MPRKRQKSELAKLLSSTEKQTYETSLVDCEKWFKILNSEIFGNRLPEIDLIDIRWRRKKYASYRCDEFDDGTKHTTLRMNKKYRSKTFFVSILLHEMIHHYQFMNGQPLGHGESFLCWKEAVNNLGLELYVAYE